MKSSELTKISAARVREIAAALRVTPNNSLIQAQVTGRLPYFEIAAAFWRLEALLAVLEPLADAPTCAWCGAPAFGFMYRFGDQAEPRGSTCAACHESAVQGGCNPRVTETYPVIDLAALRVALGVSDDR